MEQIKELRERVIKANRLYDELRMKIGISEEEPYQREGIRSLSEPFIKGVFTLAVIGQMSAGKSAFINALLEDEDLLPTGHFQTTCTLTEIVWGQEKKLRITYGDGHIQEFGNEDDISTELKNAVAIPERFSSLPINHIHEFILRGQGFKEILAHKNVIKKLSKRDIDEELVKEYVLGNMKEGILPKTKSNIPVHVYMEYPLSDSYRGWRIVDTPGIGALGGIDQATKDFLANDTVDAAIFMFNGSDHIEKTDLMEMVSNAFTQLSDVAKERTFFVITHAGEATCRNNIDATYKIALQLFSEGDVSIPKERFFAVDSMLSLLYDCAIVPSNLDPMIFDDRKVKVDSMSEGEIKMFRSMIVLLLDELEKDNKELNTENLNKKIVEVAGFAALKQALGDFARDAKIIAYNGLFDTILLDLRSFGSKKMEEIELWRSKLTKTPKEFEDELNAKKKEIEKYRSNILKKYNQIILSYGADVLDEMFDKSLNRFQKKVNIAMSLAEIDSAYATFQDMFPIEEELVMTKFVSDCRKLGEIEISSEMPSITLPPVDIEAAKQKAKKAATTSKSYETRVEKKGIWNFLSRALGIGGYDYETRYYDVIDDKKKLESYRAILIDGAKETIKEFCQNLFADYIQPTGKDIQKQLDKLVEQKMKEYDTIKDAMASATEISDKIAVFEEHRVLIKMYNDKLEQLKKMHSYEH